MGSSFEPFLFTSHLLSSSSIIIIIRKGRAVIKPAAKTRQRVIKNEKKRSHVILLNIFLENQPSVHRKNLRTEHPDVETGCAYLRPINLSILSRGNSNKNAIHVKIPFSQLQLQHRWKNLTESKIVVDFEKCCVPYWCSVSRSRVVSGLDRIASKRQVESRRQT